MSWWPSGLIPILIYGGFSQAIEENGAILTENNLDILTEASDELLVESS